MEGSRFCSPSQKVLNEDERSGFPNDDLTYLLFWCSCSRGPHRRAALAMRYASARVARDLASQLQKAATKPAENSS
jgi:hypothetical protein